MAKTARKLKTKKHLQTKKYRGGIRILNEDPWTAFDYFIRNSTFSMFSTRGTECKIVLARLNDGADSPYRTNFLLEDCRDVREVGEPGRRICN